MANEFRKVTDQNGVDHPVCDDTRVDWSSYAVTGAYNELPNNAVSGSSSNVSWVVNEDGSVAITTNGTASGDVTIWVTGTGWGYANAPKNILEKGVQYHLTDGNGDASPETYFLAMSINTSEGDVLDPNTGSSSGIYNPTFTVPNTDNLGYLCYIRIKSGQTVNKTIKPMVSRFSDVPYSPYAMTNQQLTDAISLNEGTSLITGSDMTINDCAVAKAGNIRVYSIRATADINIPQYNNIFSGFDDPLFNYDAMMSISAYTIDGAEYKLLSNTGTGKLYLKTLSSIPANTMIRFTFTYIAK